MNPLNLAIGAGLLGLAIASRKLPAPQRHEATSKLGSICSADYRDYLSVALAAGAASKTNEAFGLKLPPWLAALQTLALSCQLVRSIKVICCRWPFAAPMVAGVVQAASFTSDRVTPVAKKAGIPDWMTKVGLLATTLIGMFAINKPYMTAMYKLPIIQKWVQSGVVKSGAAMVAAVCSRGCCTQLICTTEIAEAFGDSWPW